MHLLAEASVGRHVGRVLMSHREDGNLSSVQKAAEVDPVRSALAPGPWTWLRQVHGHAVVTVNSPGDGAGTEADAAVTAVVGAVLAVQVADCVPVAFLSDEGVIGVAHAGWKGLAGGVLRATHKAMQDLGARHFRAVVGPSICAACYEFGESELEALADQFGPEVRGETAQGTPAMDMEAGVRSALGQLGVQDVAWHNDCTSCHPERFWSWRARSESGRQAMIVMMEDHA